MNQVNKWTCIDTRNVNYCDNLVTCNAPVLQWSRIDCKRNIVNNKKYGRLYRTNTHVGLFPIKRFGL